MAAILSFANIAAPWGAHQKSKQYDMGDLVGQILVPWEESEPKYPWLVGNI